MYQVNNRIEITSPEHLIILKGMFSNAPESMKQVPGFVSFRLLEAEDGSHMIVESIFETKDHFLQWTESEHFRQAHGGDSGKERRVNITGYHVVIK
ncbi:antibiotic biosynthesis monooxygenase family protein [Paenactinomyces guangxiensis]|uniref:Antibiotic biosynthesis monooxygenase n=1 Tax=Paenactinomyces guangxiensis TaxID=1490290 RepID=A0A7W1WUB8_9BACL|nr:antibiotic biosynthesis monooxygenase family protein [Paenactinomyces guangxiensis]MBA4496016.1 antibiotic biosynthesis monooxygenase [Paenactinomyces guangxiensis]MBH8593108.1 antibiotic biosynthesis monooxygenase [Paenactinomyces guangxiensis]